MQVYIDAGNLAHFPKFILLVQNLMWYLYVHGSIHRNMQNELIFYIVYTVEPRYLELAYFELPLISKWKSGPCFDTKLWQ